MKILMPLGIWAFDILKIVIAPFFMSQGNTFFIIFTFSSFQMNISSPISNWFPKSFFDPAYSLFICKAPTHSAQ
jgi:hypothetical protein